VRRALVTAAVGAALCGCGSGGTDDLPPAAEPSVSPPLTARPAGTEIPVGPAPEGVVADPVTGLVAVGLRTPDRLAIFDPRQRRVVKRVPLSESPRHLQLAAPGGPVLVPAERANALDLVDLPGGARRSVEVGGYPHDAAPAAGRHIWVGDEHADTVSVVEGDRVVRTLEVARQPGGLTSLADGRRVAIVAVRERVLEVFDARTYERVGRAPAGVGPTHVVSDGRGLLYVVDTQGDALLVFDVAPKLQLTRRVYLRGSPYGIAIDREHGRIWVTLTARNRVVELAAGRRPRPLRELPTVRQPDTVAVDPRRQRGYVTGRTAGTLQVFSTR